MSEHKNVAYRPLHKGVNLYYFTWNAVEYRYEASLEPLSENRYEGLFDGDESGGDWADNEFFVHSYLFPSPRTKNYNEFVKERCAKIYMNPWTTRECKLYADKVELDDQNEWFMRYNLVGGKPRLLFSESLDLETLMNQVRTAISLTFIDLEAVIKSVQAGSHYDPIKNILFELFRDVVNPAGYFIQFASGTIDCMLSAAFDTASMDEIKRNLMTSNANAQAWRGHVCERLLLENAAISKMWVRALEGEGTPAGSIQSLGPYNAKSTIIQGASEIFADEMLYRPISKTFPSIDGVLVVPNESRVIYLQTTVSLRHSIQHQALKDVIETLVGRGFAEYTHIFLFLVEADTYDQFQKQRFKNKDMADRKLDASFGVVVTQYVGKIDKTKKKGTDGEAQETN